MFVGGNTVIWTAVRRRRQDRTSRKRVAVSRMGRRRTADIAMQCRYTDGYEKRIGVTDPFSNYLTRAINSERRNLITSLYQLRTA